MANESSYNDPLFIFECVITNHQAENKNISQKPLCTENEVISIIIQHDKYLG